MRAATLIACVIYAATAAAVFDEFNGNDPANNVKKYNSVLDIFINPTSPWESDRTAWCSEQFKACGHLCDHQVNKNDCSSKDLLWECLCAANNSMPGIEYYAYTLPFYMCHTAYTICVNEQKTKLGKKQCKENILNICPTRNWDTAEVPTYEDVAEAHQKKLAAEKKAEDELKKLDGEDEDEGFDPDEDFSAYEQYMDNLEKSRAAMRKWRKEE